MYFRIAYICLNQLLKKPIDGLLFEPTGGYINFCNSEIAGRLKRLDIPVVIMDWAVDDCPFSYVSLDDYEGGFLATDYLIKSGHKRIAYLYPDDKLPAIQRYRGHRSALEKNGITHLEHLDKRTTGLAWDTEGEIERLVEKLLSENKNPPTAICFYNDAAAIRGCKAIRAAKKRVPLDISVVGYDDADFSAFIDVPLTTVIHPKFQIGKWAAEILFDEIENYPHSVKRKMIMKPSLIKRNSVKVL